MFGLFSRKFGEYSHIWTANSEWAIYKTVYNYNYLYINTDDVKPKIYSLWKKVHPDSLNKSTKEVKTDIDGLGAGWHKIRVIPDKDISAYGELCDKYECQWKIEAEEVIDYDIAHIETAESLDCPDEIYDELVQYAIKKGASVYVG